jgi:UDP-glucose 4-epimerase
MKWNQQRVLITGGAGFIGSNLASRLVKEKAEVLVLDNFSAGKKEKIPSDCTVIRGNIEDTTVFRQIEPVDYVFNFGAPSSVILFNAEPTACFQTTVCGFINLLEWAKKVKVKKVVYPSSGSVYGAAPPPQAEVDDVLPMNLYAVAKFACEHIARLYKQIPSIGLRIFAGYGPGEEHKGNFASPVTLFLDMILKDERPLVFGDGNQSRDFVYIDDVVEAIIRAAERDIIGLVNVGSGKTYTFNECIESINLLLGKNISPTYVNKPVNYLERTLADTTKMKKLLNLNPSNLEEGLQKYLAHINR